MKNMTDAERNTYFRQRIYNQPVNFEELSLVERFNWVKQELDTGDYQEEKSLSYRDVLYFGTNLHARRPEHFLYRILLEAFDITEVAAFIDDSKQPYYAVSFLQSFGLERAKPLISNEVWLGVMEMWSARELPERSLVKIILEGRAPESIAPLITCNSDGVRFLEIFGVRSLGLLPSGMAQYLKGKHLANELGL